MGQLLQWLAHDDSTTKIIVELLLSLSLLQSQDLQKLQLYELKLKLIDRLGTT